MDIDSLSGLAAEIVAALTSITDPEIGGNIVDLGLIYDVTVDGDGAAHIVMTTTSRGCPAAGFLQQAVQGAVEAVAGVSAAAVELTYEPRWTPDLIRSGVFPIAARH
ncbi:MAG: metal-sulfur cluster assembly factor [Rhizobium sp.]|nr:metal-sulfur cluster assembly factor [Rhizobium sp.]